MKSEQDIRDVHDILTAMLDGSLAPTLTIPPDSEMTNDERLGFYQLLSAKIALGWAIGCPGCEAQFAERIADIKRQLREAGFRPIRIPHAGPEAN